jgi:hypothetical protein
MYSIEDGMTATGIPDRVRHALDMRELKNAETQNEAINDFRNIMIFRRLSIATFWVFTSFFNSLISNACRTLSGIPVAELFRLQITK